MAVHRLRKAEGQFTTLSNPVIRQIRHIDALGLWCFLQTMPEKWHISRTHICNHFGFGKDKYNSIVRYLRDIGLLELRDNRLPDGTICGKEWVLHHEPFHKPESPEVGFTDCWENRLSENPPTINKVINTNKGNIYAHLRQPFDDFWFAYPRKVAKAAAWKAYCKASPDEELQSVILEAIKAQKKQWADVKFIPHASSWLNQRRWEDEVEEEVEQPRYARL